MRAAAIGLLAVAGVVLVGLVAFYLTMIQPIERALAPATPKNAPVEVLDGGPDAVILMPFVTGDVPRLVTGKRLKALRAQL